MENNQPYLLKKSITENPVTLFNIISYAGFSSMHDRKNKTALIFITRWNVMGNAYPSFLYNTITVTDNHVCIHKVIKVYIRPAVNHEDIGKLSGLFPAYQSVGL